MYQLNFSKLSKQQIRDAIVYYEDISLSLGQKFEENFLTTSELLEQHPHNYFNLNKKYRRIIIKDFPYQLIYTIIETNNEVFIAGLFHLQTNPKRIRDYNNKKPDDCHPAFSISKI